MTYRLYRIRLPIIIVKWRSSKSTWHWCPYDISWERWSSNSTQCLAHSIHCSNPGLSPLRGNRVSICIHPRPISVSMGTRLMGHLSMTTPQTCWPFCMLFAIFSLMPTSCLQLQISYQSTQAFKFFIPLVKMFVSEGPWHWLIRLKQPFPWARMFFFLLISLVFISLVPFFSPTKASRRSSRATFCVTFRVHPRHLSYMNPSKTTTM